MILCVMVIRHPVIVMMTGYVISLSPFIKEKRKLSSLPDDFLALENIHVSQIQRSIF